MINKWIGIGNLTRDIELRYTQNGSAVANFSVACNETWKDKTTGEKKEQVEFINIVAFGRLAEICGEYLGKGSRIYIEGRIQTRKWQDRDGNDKYTTEIVAREMKMLSHRAEGSGQSQQHSEPPVPQNDNLPPMPEGMGDDVPF